MSVLPALEIAVVVCSATPAGGGGLAELARLDFDASVMPAAVVDLQEAAPETPTPFGKEGSWRWNLAAGWATEVDNIDNRLTVAGGGFSYFIVDDLSLEMEFNIIQFTQEEGAGTVGGNFNILARWHFVNEGPWTVYGEGGGGILGNLERVPGPSGGFFNFTPQVGAGVSYALDNEARLMLGVRLHHISNARTRSDNPPRNSILVYAGLSLPF